jgi:hypothetical protein
MPGVVSVIAVAGGGIENLNLAIESEITKANKAVN